jgi:hypothetical protein
METGAQGICVLQKEKPLHPTSKHEEEQRGFCTFKAMLALEGVEGALHILASTNTPAYGNLYQRACLENFRVR